MSAVFSNKSDEPRLNTSMKRTIDSESENGMQISKKIKISANPPHGAFASQNLENMAIYDVDREDCGECQRKMNLGGHFT